MKTLNLRIVKFKLEISHLYFFLTIYLPGRFFIMLVFSRNKCEFTNER